VRRRRTGYCSGDLIRLDRGGEMARIDKRDDVSPTEGKREYGDVEFADPTNKKYPIDSAQHVRSAWSYINHADNASKYSKKDAEEIRKRIRKAAPKFDVEIED
jgi:hypothetical protein